MRIEELFVPKKRLVLDSCVIIDFSKTEQCAIDLYSLIAHNHCAISFITKLEALGYHDLPKDEENKIRLFLPKILNIPMTESIEEETIQIRRQTKLKLPDAIIAATAIMLNAELVTTDEHFFECKYPKLQVMAVA